MTRGRRNRLCKSEEWAPSCLSLIDTESEVREGSDQDHVLQATPGSGPRISAPLRQGPSQGRHKPGLRLRVTRGFPHPPPDARAPARPPRGGVRLRASPRLWPARPLCSWDSLGKNTGGVAISSPGALPDPGIGPASWQWVLYHQRHVGRLRRGPRARRPVPGPARLGVRCPRGSRQGAASGQERRRPGGASAGKPRAFPRGWAAPGLLTLPRRAGRGGCAALTKPSHSAPLLAL